MTGPLPTPRPRRVPPFLAALAFASGFMVAAPAVAAQPDPPHLVAERLYAQRVDEFAATLPSLGRAVEHPPDTRRRLASLRREIARTREAWKRMEFLVAYAHPGSAELLFPAPLERANMSSPHTPETTEPEGLQTLQELAHEVDAHGEHETLKWLVLRLEMATRDLIDEMERLELDDRMLFEAMQAQVIQAMTLGITGFDSPATEYALRETRIALEAMRPVVDAYLPALKRRDPALARALQSAYARAIRMLARGRDFDAFDRLDFIREGGNPLYAALIDAQHALGIATFSDFEPLLRRPVSTTARNLFAPDFLDPHYYSRTIGEKPDSVQAALGRRLFFDPILSANLTQSCATCHEPMLAFADGRALGPAFNGGFLQRNSPSLTHAAWQGAQFWDMRAETLEEQIPQVIEGLDEFNVPLLEVVGRLRNHPEYPGLFREAFPQLGEPVGINPMVKAIAMYIRSLGGWNSEFDRYVRGETEWIDPAVKRGFNLFMGKADCATCHFPPTFNGVLPPFYLETESEVLGVPVRFPANDLELSPDPGRQHTHVAPIFFRSFKTPTVRNVELTAPYMHNGGMETLEDVMDFYNAGGGLGLGLDVPHQTLPPDSLGLTRREMDDIIAFMNALTDTTGFGAHRAAAGF